MMGTIGIKLANGDFFSISKENSAEKKRIVLTTVHDDQKSVQIDLYKSYVKTMADAQYIGSIVVENIAKKPKGEPSIEMNLSSGTDGTVSATAVDLDNPSNENQLSVSLQSLEEDSTEYPDFEMDDEISGFDEKDDTASLDGTALLNRQTKLDRPTELDRQTKFDQQKKQSKFSASKERKCPLQKFCCQKFPLLLLIIIVLVLLLIGLGILFFSVHIQGIGQQSAAVRIIHNLLAENHVFC